MKKYLTKKQLIVCIVLLSLIVLFVMVTLLSLSKDASEFFARTFSRAYITVIGTLSMIAPISLLEVLVIFLFFFLVGLLVKGIICLVKGNKKEGVFKFSLIVTVLFGVITSYYFACGLSYHRDPLPLELYEEKVEKTEYLPIIYYFLDDFNSLCDELEFGENGSLISPYSFEELNRIVVNEFNKIDDDYYNDITVRGKPLLSSFIYRELHIAGVSFSALGEANVDYLINQSDLPFTLAHEIAHIKGVMREQEANLLSTHVLMCSDDPYLRFSAYRRAFFNLVDIVDFLDNSAEVKSLIYSMVDERIWDDVRFTSKYFEDHNLFNKIADFFNDLYLKIVGNGGIGAYEDNMDKDDTGLKDDEGNIIYEPIYSKTQKLFFRYYYER